jgi:glycosyltransferase involved in cell wall biosynthesis
MKICLVKLCALPALSEDQKHEWVGGEEVQHAQLAVALAKLGHEVRLVVADYGQPDGAVYEGVTTLKAFRESDGIPVLRFIHPRWTKLWSAFARADSDVYYFSCAGMALGMLAMFCRIYKRRLVFRVASDSDCEPEKLLVRYGRDRWLYEYGLKRANAVLVQTESQRRALSRNYGRTGTVADMLVARSSRTPGEIKKDVDVLWVATIRQVKRPERFLELARSLPQRRFHMAGGSSVGEEDLYARIKAEAQQVRNLTFHGLVPYLDVGPLFDRTSVLVNTSDVEGFPNTFLQAWVRGIPIVTMFDPDGIVRNRNLGSSHSTMPEMLEGLQAMLEAGDAYQRASSAALDFMTQRFGEAAVLAPYLEAFSGPD